ncbi:hypothetical protein I540_3077 [Mycobacteroides abscessus subsp. bolletii 1513]|nr:hypothetical protein I540_3077 [Mycobacteroides abscessus subsp. bolletii 1513]
MRDLPRAKSSDAQIDFASQLGVPDAGQLDRRDLSDLIALAQAEKWLPAFQRPGAVETAA